MNLNQIAFQLYTCRSLFKTPAELALTFRRAREIGYAGVEVCCIPSQMTPRDVKEMLDGEGLVCASVHEAPEEILNAPGKVAERLHAYGCDLVAYPYPGGIQLSDGVAVREWIGKLQASGCALRAAGITLCYHNHHLEFRKLNGRTVLEQIYAGTAPDALHAELDTYWVQNGGGDVVAWCERLARRLSVMHLKDYTINDQNAPQFAEIGSGNLDFKKIVPAAERAGCRWFVVEQDTCPGDPIDSLEQSFRYIEANLASK